MANERNAGAKKKFPFQETKQLQIKRIVPLDKYQEIKNKTNQFIDSYFINQLQTQALDKCVAENLKKDGI